MAGLPVLPKKHGGLTANALSTNRAAGATQVPKTGIGYNPSQTGPKMTQVPQTQTAQPAPKPQAQPLTYEQKKELQDQVNAWGAKTPAHFFQMQEKYPQIGGLSWQTKPNQTETSPENQMWDDIMAEHRGSLSDDLEAVNRRAAGEQLRAAEMNASLGRGMGGGFNTAMAQAALSGRDMELQARTAHSKRGIELQMTRLQQEYERALNEDNQEHAKEVQSMINSLAIKLKEFDAGPVPGDTSTEAGRQAAAQGDSYYDKAVNHLENDAAGSKRLRETMKYIRKEDTLTNHAVQKLREYLYDHWIRTGGYPSKEDAYAAVKQYTA